MIDVKFCSSVYECAFFRFCMCVHSLYSPSIRVQICSLLCDARKKFDDAAHFLGVACKPICV